MQILVFGGTFNPPHLGHQLMVEQVLLRELPDGNHIDQVWLLPVGQHSFAKQFVAATHRLMMLELLKDSLQQQHGRVFGEKIRIEDYEIQQDAESQTYATLQFLANRHPEHTFSFLIGSDNLANFHRWHNFQEMLRTFPFYIYPRVDYPFQPLYSGMVPLHGFPESKVSSTTVREALERNQDLSQLVNPNISKYIHQEGLFS